MLTLKCLGSGSSGNCYLLRCCDEVLVIDAGLPVREIKKGLEWQIGGIQGVLITHAHADHSKAADDFKRMGIPVWQPYLSSPAVKRHYFGSFLVRSFDVPHDGEPCCGYLIDCPNGEMVLYATDCEYIKYSFIKWRIQHLLLECNYDSSLIDRELPQYSHKICGHMSLDCCKKTVQANMTDALRTVLLLHMGQITTYPEECVAAVWEIAGTDVTVDWARKGLEIVLDGGKGSVDL